MKRIFYVEVDGPLSGRENMQKDASRLEMALDIPILRFFQWAKPTISYGRLQTAEAAERFAGETGVEEIVQRPTGGGMVWHQDDISISLAWPRIKGFIPNNTSECISFIHGNIIIGLSATNIQAILSNSNNAPGQKCFSWDIKNDIISTATQQKIVGGALRWTRIIGLYQGTVKIPQCQNALIIDKFIQAVSGAFEQVLKISPNNGRVAKLADALVSEASG